jgi:hypothetical protein
VRCDALYSFASAATGFNGDPPRCHDERIGMQLDEGGESGVDLPFGACLQDMKLPPLCARRFLPRLRLGTRIVRVHEQGNYAGLGKTRGSPALELSSILSPQVSCYSRHY